MLIVAVPLAVRTAPVKLTGGVAPVTVVQSTTDPSDARLLSSTSRSVSVSERSSIPLKVTSEKSAVSACHSRPPLASTSSAPANESSVAANPICPGVP